MPLPVTLSASIHQLLRSPMGHYSRGAGIRATEDDAEYIFRSLMDADDRVWREERATAHLALSSNGK